VAQEGLPTRQVGSVLLFYRPNRFMGTLFKGIVWKVNSLESPLHGKNREEGVLLPSSPQESLKNCSCLFLTQA